MTRRARFRPRPRFAPAPTRAAAFGARGAFALLEVMISITIIAIVVTSVLRSFTQSMAAVRKMEVRTKAQAFAQQLLDQYEVKPPPEGTIEGGFGDEYWEYSFTAKVSYEEPEYDVESGKKDVKRFIPMKRIAISITFDNGALKPFRAYELETAIMGFERFSPEARRQQRLY